MSRWPARFRAEPNARPQRILLGVHRASSTSSTGCICWWSVRCSALPAAPARICRSMSMNVYEFWRRSLRGYARSIECVWPAVCTLWGDALAFLLCRPDAAWSFRHRRQREPCALRAFGSAGNEWLDRGGDDAWAVHSGSRVAHARRSISAARRWESIARGNASFASRRDLRVEPHFEAPAD